MDQANLKRIGELSKIARERALTEEEQKERAERRQAYLQAFRAQVRGQLDATVVQYPDGSRVPLKDVHKKNGGK